MKLKLALLMIALFSTACQTWTRVDPSKPFEITEGYRVEPQIEWSRMKLEHIDFLTVHGGGLESLRLTRGLEDGDPLLAPASSKDEMPVYRGSMSANEIAELTEDTMTRSGGVQVETSGLEPYSFAGLDGFRFDLAYASEAGLRYTGLAAGATFEERLYLVLFTAPALHYFGSYRETIEDLIESVTIDVSSD